jgi:hypothetical protein
MPLIAVLNRKGHQTQSRAWMERCHNGNAVKQAFYAVPSLDVLLLCVEGMQSQFVEQE